MKGKYSMSISIKRSNKNEKLRREIKPCLQNFLFSETKICEQGYQSAMHYGLKDILQIEI